MSTIKGADNNMGKGENYGKFKVDNSPELGEGRTDTPCNYPNPAMYKLSIKEADSDSYKEDESQDGRY